MRYDNFKYHPLEVIKILDKTDSWRAVDRHFGKAQNVVKSYLNHRKIRIKRSVYYTIENQTD